MNQIDVVVDVRQSLDTAELIVSKQRLTFNGEASLVGPPVETRVGFVTRKAQVTVFGFAEMGTGLILAARVKNIGTVTFPIDRVAFEHQFEQPQDFPLKSGIVTYEIGGGVDLIPRNETRKGPFQSGEEREYYFPPMMFDGVVLLAASLAPSRFWIAAYCGTEQVGKLGGEYVLPYLNRSGIEINRQALPLFDTMPEAGRLAVIKAVAALRGLERDQWSTKGAQPLEGIPHAFVLRASEDSSVIVTQTEHKGVEIVDIVRRAILDQFRKTNKREDVKP